MKPTIVNTLFGGVLIGGLFFGKSLLGYVFDSVFHLTDEGWRKLTLRWGLFFFVLAVVNEVVWRNFSTDFWVSTMVGFILMNISSCRASVSPPNSGFLPPPAPSWRRSPWRFPPPGF